MKGKTGVGSFIHSLKALIVPKKGRNPHKWNPIAYFRQIYFDEQMYDINNMVAGRE